MSRLLISFVSAVAVLVAIAGSALAATSPEIEPPAAAVGDEVTFFNGCFGVVDEPPSEVQVALTQGDQQPDDESVVLTLGTLVDPFTYSIVVPEVPPGDYWVSLECAPDDWRTNLSEPGGAAALTVCEGECVESDAVITVYKYIDADGNLESVEDGEIGQGWEFGLDLTDGTIEDASPRTNVHGIARWVISFGPDGTTARAVEVVEEDFELVGASCTKKVDAFSEPVELAFELDGDSVTFQVDPDLPYIECGFYNTPGGGTAPPTLPPTDTATATNKPIADSWRAMFVVFAAILAAGLVSVSRVGERTSVHRR
jgi:hypothetical protein